MNNFDRVFLGLTMLVLILVTWGMDVRLNALESAPSTLAQATGTPQPLDILVGQGCVGADGPNQIMVGFEEDEFTQCEAIDVHTVMVMP